mgnify:CR=1 FL=1
MIHKHEIPILEFDDSPQAVIMPTHEDLDLDLPARCIYAFLEEEIERYALRLIKLESLSPRPKLILYLL